MPKKIIVLLSLLLVLVLAAGAGKAEPVKAHPVKASEHLTYSHDIAPIIQHNCTSCHHPGDVAPFSLLTYDDVKKRVDTIEAVVEAGVMPPWKPTIGYGHFAGERKLAGADREKLLHWIKEDAPAGDLSKASKPPLYNTGWRLGQPDMIVKMPAPYNIYAKGPDEYRCFVVPLNLTEDKYVRAVEFHPSNKAVLHHALFFLDAKHEGRKLEGKDDKPGYKSFGGIEITPTGSLGGWAPGNSQQELPPGVARLLRKDSDLIMQSHFHPTGKPESEQSELGIYFAKSKPERILLPLVVNATRKIDIPAGDANWKVTTTSVVPVDYDLLLATPHAHLLCREIKSWAETPDKKTIPLIWIKNWDFNWQEQYKYAEPIRLPKGTVVTAEFTYDNSSENPKNPSNPPKRVTRGESTTDEMGIIFYNGILVNRIDMPAYLIEMSKHHVGESLPK